MQPTNVKNPDYFHKVVDCQWACPAHTPVPEYIRLIAAGKYGDAYMVNWKSNVFPGILGRTCDRPCEPACRRGRVEDENLAKPEPVAICRLKRVAADLKDDDEIKEKINLNKKTKSNGKKIACIGAGPASLTVARDLAPLGYEVTVFDQDPKPGGMIWSQIPRFRLPEEVIDEEVGYILGLGVSFVQRKIDSMKTLMKEGYDAIFVGSGAPRGRDLDIPGRKEGAKNIHIGIDWLSSVSFGHTSKIGKRVIVLGGGNTAMDCCRTSRRLGGDDVKVIVRSGFEEMKASPWEKEDAAHEGIPILNFLVPKSFVTQNMKLTGMTFEKVKAVYDSDGKRSLVKTGEPDQFFECDDVLVAVGQENAFPWLERDSGIEFDKFGLPQLNAKTFQSSVPNVFFGGDSAFGPKNIIWAVAHGHEAAISMDLLLNKESLSSRPAPEMNLMSQKMGIHEWSYDNEIANDTRFAVPWADIKKTLKNVKMEVELGFDAATAWKEAQRCLNCDVQTVFTTSACIECDACVDICPMDCISFVPNGEEQDLRGRLSAPATNLTQDLYVSSELKTQRIMAKDEDVCLHCGLCAERCPTGAWDMQKSLIEMVYAGPNARTTLDKTQEGRVMKRIEAVNDFVVKFANVNGSGSASANELFARAILRMGIPVSPRNIFPSNIQGLPTWYEVRVTEKGWLGRRGGVDLMVAMNPQTWNQDVKEVEPGGYLFYDNTKVLPQSKFRDDINVVGMPLTEISNSAYSVPRERQLFKNIICLGALAGIMDIEPGLIAELFGEQYKGKEKLLKPNLNALQLGLNYAKEFLKDSIGLKVKRAYAVGDQIFIEGNAAAALGLVYGGATVCAWYPITPSSSLAEAFTSYCSKLRVDKDNKKNKFAIIQAEDELASIGIVTGAGWNGARAFTATSGPGISLMSEFIGLAYFAEIPATIIDVQRGGPSTGMPTRTQQSDVLACAYASHGDTKHVLLFPEDPHECFTMAADCLDLAERLQTPVFLMTDLDIGMNHRLSKPLKWDDSRTYDRGKVMTAEMLDAGKEFARYKDLDGDGIGFRTYPGTHETKGAYFTRGTSKNAYATYSEAGPDYQYNMQRLLKKHDFAKTLVPKPVLTAAKAPARFGVIYYGSTSPSMNEALEALSVNSIFINALRIRAFPFADEIQDFVHSHSKVFVVEQNRDAQLKTLLVNEAHINPASLVSILHYDGTPITARFITKEISEIVAALNVRPIKKDKAA